MPENNLQKIAEILLPTKKIFVSPKKTLTQLKQQIQQSSDDMVRTKLQACLYGLKEINRKLKRTQSEQKCKQIKNNLILVKKNSVKNVQTSFFPSIIEETQDKKVLKKQKFIKQLFIQNTSHSQLSSNKLCINSSMLKQRLNQTAMNSKSNDSFNLSKTSHLMFSKRINEINQSENSMINRSEEFNFTLKTQLEKSKSPNKNSHFNKQNGLRPKIIKHLYESASGKTLPRQNRYFSNNSPSIDKNEISKIGLYQSSNRYRKQFLTNEMKQMSPKVQKKELQFIKVCKQNELFLTRPKQLEPSELYQFFKGQFVITEAKPKRYFETIHTEEIQAKFNQQNQPHISNDCLECSYQGSQIMEDHIAEQQVHETLQQVNQKGLIFLEMKNYQIVKSQQYLKFKAIHIQNWEEIESVVQQIIRYLQYVKINSWKFKANTILNYWSGKKLSVKDIQTILKVNIKDTISKQKNAFQNVLSIFCARRKIKSIIKLREKRISYMKWVCDRMIGIRSIRRETDYKIKKAYELHEKLLEGDYAWETQIYISSFSENAFVRNTTQYMESLENMFTHMWKESSKHLILVIPTINSEILQVYQQKLKIKRSITLICPEVHDLFPANMSLAGCLLFSYDALNKIKQLIEGKNAVIIPGKFSSPKYELLISEFLKTPLMTSLKPRKDLESQKQIFSSANILILPYISIKPPTTINEIIHCFAKLIFSYKQISNWVFKINGEFSGRGLATFCTKSSKVLRSILSSCKDTVQPLEQYLKINLKLKLKINFENSLFMLGDYLERLSEKGGIIEQQKDQIESYEVSFFIQNKMVCHIISCFKCFSVNHSNKAYIYEQVPNAQLSIVLPKLKSVLESQQYLGYVSVNLSISGDRVYGMQIKPYLTHLSSVQPFIKSIESKRQLKLNFSNQNHDKMQNEFVSSTLRKDFVTNRKPKIEQSLNINFKDDDNKISKDQSHIFSNINLSITELQSYRPNLLQFTYLFLPNIILTDVATPKKADFIQSIVVESFSRNKFDILDNNLVLYLSNGLSLSLLIVGRQMKKIKKIAVEVIRFLSQKSGALKTYCGKNQARDVFQFGDIIKAVTQIKT